ncbi:MULTISPECIES: hypothetical protein [unclassified Streptomyces]|uniref:hypothetical protein n=1 Tax=unclassified Streptomyces TaxID=2593676 RepID=UPI0036F615E7
MTGLPAGAPRTFYGPTAGTVAVRTSPEGSGYRLVLVDGGPDVLVRDGEGRLSVYEVNQLIFMRGTGCGEEACRPVVRELGPDTTGTGGNTYTLMASPGNAAGGAGDEIVGLDRDGVLWPHQGEKQKLLPRTKAGGGWQKYTPIISAGPSSYGGSAVGVHAFGPTGSAHYSSADSTSRPFAPAYTLPLRTDATRFRTLF